MDTLSLLKGTPFNKLINGEVSRYTVTIHGDTPSLLLQKKSSFQLTEILHQFDIQNIINAKVK